MPSFKFTLKNRLRQADLFNSIFKNGSRLSSRHFIFFYLPNNASESRLGIVASKRKCRFAVDRNHVRRLVREAFRQNQHNLPGLDLVVLLKSKVKDSQDPELASCLINQFLKLARRSNSSK